jgi:pyruvate kinase
VHCIVAEDARDLDDMVNRACSLAFREGFAKAGPAHHHRGRRSARHAGATNMVRIAFVGPDAADDA